MRKSCIYDADAGLGGGVYHWQSVAAADEWHGADWHQLVRDLYGSDSVARRFEVLIVADNEQDKTIMF